LGKRLTALDPNFGTKADLANLVKKSTCSRNKNRDGVINHTGPITETDVAWPNYWVRTSPVCDYKNYQNTTECTVANLPDIRTESTQNVDLLFLIEKWKKEGVTTRKWKN
jgi:alpha-amylase